MADVRVYLEEGKHWCFAAAIDWPGWCRRANSDEAAIEALEEPAVELEPSAGLDGRQARDPHAGLRRVRQG